MKKPKIKNRKIYIPDYEEEPRLLSKRRNRKHKEYPNVFNKKRNPHAFIVEWQLSEEDSVEKQEKEKPKK